MLASFPRKLISVAFAGIVIFLCILELSRRHFQPQAPSSSVLGWPDLSVSKATDYDAYPCALRALFYLLLRLGIEDRVGPAARRAILGLPRVVTLTDLKRVCEIAGIEVEGYQTDLRLLPAAAPVIVLLNRQSDSPHYVVAERIPGTDAWSVTDWPYVRHEVAAGYLESPDAAIILKPKTNHAPPANRPALHFDRHSVDLGSHLETELLSRRISVRNRGTVPVDILEVRPSCACTEYRLSGAHLPVGCTAELFVTFRAPAKAGRWSGSISLLTTDPSHPVQRLRAGGVAHKAWHCEPDFLVFQKKDIFERDNPSVSVRVKFLPKNNVFPRDFSVEVFGEQSAVESIHYTVEEAWTAHESGVHTAKYRFFYGSRDTFPYVERGTIQISNKRSPESLASIIFEIRPPAGLRVRPLPVVCHLDTASPDPTFVYLQLGRISVEQIAAVTFSQDTGADALPIRMKGVRSETLPSGDMRIALPCNAPTGSSRRGVLISQLNLHLFAGPRLANIRLPVAFVCGTRGKSLSAQSSGL